MFDLDHDNPDDNANLRQHLAMWHWFTGMTKKGIILVVIIVAFTLWLYGHH